MTGPEQQTSLDLVDPRLIAPKLRRVALVAAAVGVGCALVLGLLVSWSVGLIVGLVVGGPTAASALLALRRRTWLAGTTIRSQRAIGQRSVDAARAISAELQVRTGRVSQVGVRIQEGDSALRVPLALYTDTGGAELGVLGLRRLADALSAGELAAAAAVSSVLVEQLRAEARGAGLEERPLYAAVRLVRDSGRAPFTTLSDAEVASLLD